MKSPEMGWGKEHTFMGEESVPVGLILLAAGGSTRLGAPKQLLLFRGRSLLIHACETALASVCRPVVVVLGAEREQLRDEIEREITNRPLQIAENPQWRDGLGTSIRVGVQALEEYALITKNLDAAILMLCDQPLLTAPHLDELVRTHYTTQKQIVASSYGQTAGVPALFGRALWSELLNLPPHSGAKMLIDTLTAELATVPFAGGVFDIDTTADYDSLRQRLQ
jgi:molybdenum cofactor cytidylyltransferase